ncbi:hypothetical protein thsps117_37620 [Pseudomonas sp. No.117]
MTPESLESVLNTHLKSIATTYQAAITLITAYMLGQLLGVVSSFTLERSYIRKHGYPSRKLLGHKPAGDKKPTKKIEFFWDAHTFIAEKISKILVPDQSFSANALEKPIIEIIENKIKDYFVKNHKTKDTSEILTLEYFHHIYHYCVENSPNHLSKIQNYVALYGLMRNTAYVCAISTWGILINSAYFFVLAISQGEAPSFSIIKLTMLFVSISVFSIFYLGFSKFYKRYSTEVVMAFSVSYEYEKRDRSKYKPK